MCPLIVFMSQLPPLLPGYSRHSPNTSRGEGGGSIIWSIIHIGAAPGVRVHVWFHMSAVFAYPKQAFLAYIYGKTASINAVFTWNAYTNVWTAYGPVEVRDNFLIKSTLYSFGQTTCVVVLDFHNTVKNTIFSRFYCTFHVYWMIKWLRFWVLFTVAAILIPPQFSTTLYYSAKLFLKIAYFFKKWYKTLIVEELLYYPDDWWIT